MIQVVLCFDSESLLRSCTVEGHAGQGPVGADIVCAAASVLARTGLKTLVREGVDVRAEAPQRGHFSIVTNTQGGGQAALRTVGVFLEEGFASLAQEYPDALTLDIRSEWRNYHGS